MKRPYRVTVVAVLMCIGAALLALGSLGFFLFGGTVVTTGTGGPTSQLFSEMGGIGAGIFLALGVVYATLAIYMFRLVRWVRRAAIAFIAVGLLFAVIGILVSLAHPDLMVFVWQLFVIAVDAYTLRYLMTPHVKDAFASQGHRPAARIDAHT